MKKLTLVLMVVGLGLLLSASAFAFDSPCESGGPGPAFGSPDGRSLW